MHHLIHGINFLMNFAVSSFLHFYFLSQINYYSTYFQYYLSYSVPPALVLIHAKSFAAAHILSTVDSVTHRTDFTDFITIFQIYSAYKYFSFFSMLFLVSCVTLTWLWLSFQCACLNYCTIRAVRIEYAY